MRCYDCEKVTDTLFPVRRTEGDRVKIVVDVYVCKDCLRRLMEAKE